MADFQSSRSRKKSTRKHKRKDGEYPAHNTQEDTKSFDSDDNESVLSFASTVDNTLDETLEEGIDCHEDFESKLIENLEGCRQKGAHSREVCLLEVKKALCRRYMNEFVLTRKETILDFVEKLLKKGENQDRILSSAISCALCIQLGDGESLSVFQALKPILISLINDDALSSAVKASAASALGLSCFIGAEEQEDTHDCLIALKTAFSKKIPADSVHHASFANSLLSWGLLLTVASQSVVEEQILNIVGTICKLLEMGDLNLRIAAGETVALVYELARQSRVHLQGPINTLYGLLRELANESGRHKGKREKKQQRSSFRDIWKSVETRVAPDETIKFGLEYIQMTSWAWLRRYNAFKDALNSGTNTHLESNMFLRDIFGLGLPISKEMKDSKITKYEKVKDPVICSNAHIFCKSCLEMWLKQRECCPTCRTTIDERHPYQTLVGSLDSSEETCVNHHDPFLKSRMRRTRLKVLFEEFQTEADYLEKTLKTYSSENMTLKEENLELRAQLEKRDGNGLKRSVRQDTITRENKKTIDSDEISTVLKLSNKLQELIKSNANMVEVIAVLQKDIKVLQEEKETHVLDVERLKEESKFPRSPQKYNKYAMVALQTKVDTYEREIHQWKKALNRADEHIEQLTRELERYKTFDKQLLSGSSSASSTLITSSRQDASLSLSVGSQYASSQQSFGIMRNSTLPISAADTLRMLMSRSNTTENNTVGSSQTLEEIMPITKQIAYPSTSRNPIDDISRFPASAKLLELTTSRANISSETKTLTRRLFQNATPELSDGHVSPLFTVPNSIPEDSLSCSIGLSSVNEESLSGDRGRYVSDMLQKNSAFENAAVVSLDSQSILDQSNLNFIDGGRQHTTLKVDTKKNRLKNPNVCVENDSPVKKIKVEDVRK